MPKPRVLVACEFSGRVRDAFIAKGCNAFSCDLLPSEAPALRNHFQCPVEDVLDEGWDLMVAHPPCTHLAVSGARWFKAKAASGSQRAAIEFFLTFTRLTCKWAIENPVGIMSTRYRKPDQIIHPWQFGHGETKATCLWLNGLPRLTPTNIVSGREHRIHRLPPGPDRWKLRSVTYQGIADAMAEQWNHAN